VTSTATAQEPKKARISATTQIILGLVIGVITGYIVSITNPDASEAIRPFAQLFIRMIQMIIAPLLFATLVAGIAGAGHFKDVGRMGLRAIIYFEVVTTLALLIGLLAVNIMQPGVGLTLPAPTGPPPITARPQSWQEIILHVFPTSVFDAMARGDVLQIVIFSMLFAIGLSMLGERGRPIVTWCEVLAETMFKVTHIIMLYAPIGVGAAIAYTIGVSGLTVLQNLAFMILSLYLALAAFYLLVLIPVMVMFRIPIVGFFKSIKEPALIAFSTTSSEAALPRAMECVEAFGVPRRIV